MSKLINMLTTGLAMTVVATVAIGLFTAKPAHAEGGCRFVVLSIDPEGRNNDEKYICDGQDRAPSVTTRRIDPCFQALNALRPCAAGQRQPAKPAGLDPALVGIWETPVAGGLWVLQIFSNGTYKFHGEGLVFVTPSAGSFSANDGQWSLKATDGYTDGGAYSLPSRTVWAAVGNFGPGVWIRRS